MPAHKWLLPHNACEQMALAARRLHFTAIQASRPRVHLLSIVVCLCTAAVVTARGAQEPSAPAGFALAAWPTERSLPGDVLAIAQDLEGYLWLGTPDGLVRFDGSRFEPWTRRSGASTLPASPVAALSVSSKGGLWIGYSGGAGVARLYQGRATRYLAADGAPPGVNALIEDRRGTIWAAASSGLFCFDGMRWSRLTSKDGFDGEQSVSVYEDHMSRIWVGSAGGLYRRDEGSFHLVDRARVESLAEDEAGNLCITDRTAGVRKLGAPAPRIHPDIRLPLPGWRVARDHKGGLMVASFSGGLFRIAQPTSASPNLEPVPVEQRLRGSPRALFEDRDDHIWVGMRGGLLRLSENTFRSADPLDGLDHEGVRTAAVGPDGSIWVATTHALNQFVGEIRRSCPVLQGRALSSDQSGTMWVATDDAVGRFVNGRLIAEPISGVADDQVHALAVTSGRLWLCTAFRGVVSWRAGTLTSHSARPCSALMADRHGRVWAGFATGGVALFEGGTVRALTERDGLAPGAVLQIIEGRDGSLWFATSEGLSRYQSGRFVSVTPANLPVNGIVPLLVEDDQGYIWVGVQSGVALLRFHSREMDKVAARPRARLVYALYDESDGLLPGTRTWRTGVGGVRDSSGRLWVVNGPSMTIIDPRRLRDARPPSPPRLDAITVNGQRRQPSAGGKLPNRATVQIDFAALSLSDASKLRFRHLLDGVDTEWVYDGEEQQARYSNLPAGDYRFRVSTTIDGHWTESAVWAFTVAPPFFLTWWFLSIAGAAIVCSSAIGIRLRVRAFKARFALVAAERVRMSHEIHDTLLQSLAALGPELEALAVRAGPTDGSVAEELRRIRREVRRSVREARDSILELRRRATGTSRLADSLDDLAGTIAARHGVRPTVVVTGRRPEHRAPEVEPQMYQIAREAVTNAIRHGQPTRIDIAVAYDGSQVSVMVRDNGCGFEPNDAAAARSDEPHFGLDTMRERVEKIGGRLRIESTSGDGTTVPWRG
jgi:signal transduction histidine kinase/ligand-binding sensor domain-containing protein